MLHFPSSQSKEINVCFPPSISTHNRCMKNSISWDWFCIKAFTLKCLKTHASYTFEPPSNFYKHTPVTHSSHTLSESVFRLNAIGVREARCTDFLETTRHPWKHQQNNKFRHHWTENWAMATSQEPTPKEYKRKSGQLDHFRSAVAQKIFEKCKQW